MGVERRQMTEQKLIDPAVDKNEDKNIEKNTLEMERAREADLEQICTFYQRVIADLERRTNYPLWTWGVHPSAPMLKEALERNELMLLKENGQMIACAMINPELEGEEQIDWNGSSPLCIHLLAIDPALGKRGLGAQFVSMLVEWIRHQGADSIRLNLIEGNLPARHVYAQNGFISKGHIAILLDDEGELPFEMMELIL